MIEVEFFVVICCGFLGYGIVSFLIDHFRKRRESANSQTQNQTPGSPSNNREGTGRSTSKDSSCWDVLGVSERADESEIRNAYKTLIRQYQSGDATDLGGEFKEIAKRKAEEINAAYESARSQRGLK